uniref:FTH domain-containing protein n=1 Tax=Panagrellus redivivus TaxID=6233 RepID=A0A7E4ZY94_PANRE
MTAVVLKPHLLAETYDICFEKLYLFSLQQRESIFENALRTALTSKLAFCRFVYSLRCNCTLWFSQYDVKLNYDGMPFLIDGKCLNLIQPFLKFAYKVSFFRVKFGTAGEDDFMKRLEDVVDLRHMIMHDHTIGIEVQKKMVNVFAKLTIFDVDVGTFVTLLDETDVPFPNLEHLKLYLNPESIDTIVTTSDRFPVLECLEVHLQTLYETLTDLRFAENPFPTVKNLSINVYDFSALNSPVEFNFEFCKNWLKSFSSLKKAEVSIKKYIFHVPNDDHERKQHLQSAFRSTDYGVDLDLIFKIESLNSDYQWQYRLPFRK